MKAARKVIGSSKLGNPTRSAGRESLRAAYSGPVPVFTFVNGFTSTARGDARLSKGFGDTPTNGGYGLCDNGSRRWH